VASWPAALPQSPLLQGASGSFAKTAIRTSMDAGAAKVRRRFTAAVRPFKCSFEVTAAQLATLEDFFANTLAGGALSFTFPHPLYGTVTMRFVTDEPPAWQPRDDPSAFEVQLSLEVMP
jgi:hypothetical protein